MIGGLPEPCVRLRARVLGAIVRPQMTLPNLAPSFLPSFWAKWLKGLEFGSGHPPNANSAFPPIRHSGVARLVHGVGLIFEGLVNGRFG
jgi:hypothetical protein